MAHSREGESERENQQKTFASDFDEFFDILLNSTE